jgi:hypothetical protein
MSYRASEARKRLNGSHKASLLSGREKQDQIDKLRQFNAVARTLPGHESFCDAMEEALLELEDVATDAVQ